MAICSVPGCGRTATARGLCPMHYMRLRRTKTTGPAAPYHDGSLTVDIRIRLSSTERALYETAAERADLTLSEWGRKRLTAAARKELHDA